MLSWENSHVDFGDFAPADIVAQFVIFSKAFWKAINSLKIEKSLSQIVTHIGCDLKK